MTDLAHPDPERIAAAIRLLDERRGPGDRQVAAPPYRRTPVVIDGVTFTACRLCAGAIAGADGRPDRRRLWHPPCVEAYNAVAFSERMRREVFRRDRGICADCGQAWRDWDADHIVPIIDGGALCLANLQTLCSKCHAVKTAREATERAERRQAEARRRKAEAVRDSGQFDLFDLAALEATS